MVFSIYFILYICSDCGLLIISFSKTMLQEIVLEKIPCYNSKKILEIIKKLLTVCNWE